VCTTALTKEGGNEPLPDCKALGGVIRSMFFDGQLELKMREELLQLRGNARKSLHARISLAECSFGKINLTQVGTDRALLISYLLMTPEPSVLPKPVLDKKDLSYLKGNTIVS